MSQQHFNIRYPDGAGAEAVAYSHRLAKESALFCSPYHQHMTNMDCIRAVLLFSLLQTFHVVRAAPLSKEAVNMRTKVKMNAEQLVRKIDLHLRDQFSAAQSSLSGPTDQLDGLSSIVKVLEGYEGLLSETLDGIPQLKQEVSSLRGYVDSWKQVHCSEQQAKPSVQGRLAELQSHKQYIHTVGFEALRGLKEFLKSLLKNLDHLGTCYCATVDCF